MLAELATAPREDAVIFLTEDPEIEIIGSGRSAIARLTCRSGDIVIRTALTVAALEGLVERSRKALVEWKIDEPPSAVAG